MGEVERCWRETCKAGLSILRASSAKRVEEREGKFISGLKGTFSWDLYEVLHQTCSFHVVSRQSSCLCGTGMNANSSERVATQPCIWSIYSVSVAIHKCMKMPKCRKSIYSLWAWKIKIIPGKEGLAAFRVVGAKWSGRTCFPFPINLGGRYQKFQRHLPALERYSACLEEPSLAWSALSPGRAATAPNRQTTSAQWRCSWSIVGTQHEWR